MKCQKCLYKVIYGYLIINTANVLRIINDTKTIDTL